MSHYREIGVSQNPAVGTKRGGAGTAFGAVSAGPDQWSLWLGGKQRPGPAGRRPVPDASTYSAYHGDPGALSLAGRREERWTGPAQGQLDTTVPTTRSPTTGPTHRTEWVTYTGLAASRGPGLASATFHLQQPGCILQTHLSHCPAGPAPPQTPPLATNPAHRSHPSPQAPPHRPHPICKE